MPPPVLQGAIEAKWSLWEGGRRLPEMCHGINVEYISFLNLRKLTGEHSFINILF